VGDGPDVTEYDKRDEAECLALRNEVFPPISVDDWRRGTTAAVARSEGRVVGVIPFKVRPFQLRNGVQVRAAFANSVAVADGCRGQGVGSAMMRAAARFLRERAEVMLVYTDDEGGGRPYRFYRATGHADLAFPARYRLSGGAGNAGGDTTAQPVDPGAITDLEPELLGVFRQTWGTHGGFVSRTNGYYSRAFSSHIFVELPLEELFLVRASAGKDLGGYAIAGIRGGTAQVLEWAWASPATETAVIGGLRRFAEQRNVEVVTWSCRPPFEPFGGKEWSWAREPRNDVLAGRCIRPEEVWALAAGEPGRRLRLCVWTPEGSVDVGPTGSPPLCLEMKRRQLDQLLLCRRSLEEDVRLQRATVAAGTWEQVAAVSRALRPAPWECHQLDYI
jgi:ribosomal protein S18 acetylase RimI-like enzyme